MRARIAATALFLLLLPSTHCAAHDGARDATPSFEWDVRYTADALANVHGGLRAGSAWIDNLELTGAVDAGRALGIGNLALFANLVRTNPPTFSDRYVGDAMIVSSIDSERALRVLEAWADWGFEARGPGSVRVGLYDVNSEFDTTESRGLFINSAYGMGQELAQTGRTGPSVYPLTALAARVAWSPSEPWQLELAVVDGAPGDPGGTRRSRWHLSQSEGALCLAEATALAGPVAQVSLGYWRYTAAFEGLRPVHSDGRGRLERDNHGTYLTAEITPRSGPNDSGPRWSGFVRAGAANDRINRFERHVAAGVVVSGRWPGPHGSQLGFAAAEARVGREYRAVRRRDGEPADRYERNVELTWRVPLGAHVVLQPDLQYVVNPGTDRRIPDAWIVGVRLELSLAR